MKHQKAYLNANKEKKSKILDFLVSSTGLHRKSLIRKLNTKKSKGKRGGSKSKYHQDVPEILTKIWKMRDYICAELLHPYLSESIRYLAKSKQLDTYSTEAISQIRTMPLGTLKFKLGKLNGPRKGRSYYRRSKSNLKKKVAICTDMNMVSESGHFELDFVDHNGGDSSGQFARSLCCVDVHTQYIIRGTTRGKGAEQTREIFDDVINRISIDIKKLHTDNEPGLLASLIRQKLSRLGLSISRSRSYRKEDNGHVEQKNGDKIRRLVGYRRYDQDKQVNLLNRIYQLDDKFQNHFIPSRKVVEKVYDEGGKLARKKYDEAKTPYARILEDDSISKEEKKKLRQIHGRLDPIKLKNDRDKLLRKLKSS